MTTLSEYQEFQYSSVEAAEYDRACVPYRVLQRVVDQAANDLLDAAQELMLLSVLDAWDADSETPEDTATGEPLAATAYENAESWLRAHARRRGELPDPVPATAAHRRLHVLADRDGWVCYICGVGLVDVCTDDDMLRDAKGGRYLNPSSTRRLPHREHKVPLALGGSERLGNLGLACGPCNLAKGAS